MPISGRNMGTGVDLLSVDGGAHATDAAALAAWQAMEARTGGGDPSASIPAGTLYFDSTNSRLRVADGSGSWNTISIGGVAITDPGHAGAIPVTTSGVCNLVSTGAQTRTIAIPTFVGQTITLSFDTDGGNVVVTAAAAINVADQTIMTFSAPSQTITLVGVTVGGAKVWAITGNDGVALS